MARKHVLILASGGGSNAEALVKYANKNALNIDFACASDKLKEEAGVYNRMAGFGVRTDHVPMPGKNFALLRALLQNPKSYNRAYPKKFDLVLMAGFMRILPPDIVKNNTVLNIHPSILPYVYVGSKDAYQDALNNGDLRTGCTVHIATADVDMGPVLAQIGFEIPKPVIENKDIDALRAIGLAHEHVLYPAVMHAVLYQKLDNLNMIDLVGKARMLLAERNLQGIMNGYATIAPPGNYQRKFSSWNARGI